VTSVAPPAVELAALARQIAHDAAFHAAELRQLGLTVSTKSTGTDMVTDADRATEALIIERLLAERPDDGILGEEGGERHGSSGVRWVIDPIDGTTNFVYDHPGWAVSIGAEIDGEVVAGAVAVPTLGAEFHAASGHGAYLGDRRLHLPSPPPLAEALVATGFGYAAERRARQGTVAAALLPRVRDLRRMGAAAVDLCSLAAGRIDAYYEAGLQAWDLAAGGLIATEAGARLGALSGGPARPGDVVGCHPDLFDELVGLLLELGADRV
jgi:myo-inositol-1(or 4)-monophosphatase